MRILHCIGALVGGGAERQLAYIAPETASRGHDVHVAFFRRGSNYDLLANSACRLHHIRDAGKYDATVVLRLLWLIRKVRPHVLQTWLTHMDIVGGAAAILSRKPWILTERSAPAMYDDSVLNRLRAGIGKRASLICANSEGGANYWSTLGVDPAKIVIIPNIVRFDDIDAAFPVDDARLRPADQIVLQIGRLSPEKNLERVVDAMALVSASRPEARLVICGEGPMRSSLERRVALAGLTDRVIFAGFVNNVAAWLKRAAVLVNASTFEGHPNAVLEAIAAGTPVVASDIPAHRAVLGDDGALFANAASSDDLASAIVMALRNRTDAIQRASRARLRIDSLSINATVERYEDLYLRAAGIADDRRAGGRPAVSLNTR